MENTIFDVATEDTAPLTPYPTMDIALDKSNLTKHESMISLNKTNTYKKKSISSRIWFGIKSGWELPTLPDHIYKLEQNIYVRLFKLIGVLCMFFSFSGIANDFNHIIFYIILVISLLYILYRLTIIVYSVKQWYHILVTPQARKYMVRNSPVDISATMFRGTIHTLKTAVNFTIGTGLTFGLCHELDQILVDEGIEPYFVPKIKSAIASAGLDDALPWWRS